MQRILILLIALAGLAHADTIEQRAKAAGLTVKQARSCEAMGLTFNPVDGSYDNRADLDAKHKTKHTDVYWAAIGKKAESMPKPGTYYWGEGNIRLLDGNGEYHFIHYINSRTRAHWVEGRNGNPRMIQDGVKEFQLANGRWITPDWVNE